MCGIVGAINPRDLKSYLLNGLKDLDYRGYDSAGIAILNDQKFNIYRHVGRVNELENKLPNDLMSKIGIGHTRWATHGAPLEKNSHPHLSFHKNFAIVHNGVIENYLQIKNQLISEGVTFYSDTDTEVIVNLIEKEFLKTGDILLSLNNAIKLLTGSLAIALIYVNDETKIYFAKRKSPLLIGLGNGSNYVASDALPMLKDANKFISILDEQYGFISDKEVKIFEDENIVEPKYINIDRELLNQDLNGYSHYMLKEIEEIPTCINRLVNNYILDGNYTFDTEMIKALKNANTVTFIACGTSYHACLIGKKYMESLHKRSNVFVASEWGYFPQFEDNEIFILLSQSGETADLIKCFEILKSHNKKTITITNCRGSTLDRESTWSALLYAGVEIAVASTKAYNAQVALLYLLKSCLANDYNAANKLLDNNQKLKSIINKKEKIHEIAREIKDANHAFFLGRGSDYYVALEASLKLKEITYIHSEAFAGGELKHGPLALIEKDTPVFGFVTIDHINKAIRGNFSEVTARGAKLFTFVSKSLAESNDSLIIDDFDGDLSPLGVAMIAQYLSYYTALERNKDIDKPRNLAKSVTVE